VLFGLACFPLYSGAGLADDAPSFAAWRKGRMAAAAVLALASGIGWLALTTAGMSGEASDVVSPGAIASVISDTGFGKLWILRLAGCLILIALAFIRRPRWAPALAASIVLASLAGTGHGGLPDDTALGRLHTTADAVHLLAAGLWIGALWALGWMVMRRPHAPETATALRRFSGVGQLAVAALIATGLVNAFAIMGRVDALWTTGYGRLLALKLLAFAAMLVFAGLNRWVLTPRVEAGGDAAGRLRWHILGEQALSFVVVGVVAVIGASDPAA
jgi:putative copper resistance protein D